MRGWAAAGSTWLLRGSRLPAIVVFRWQSTALGLACFGLPLLAAAPLAQAASPGQTGGQQPEVTEDPAASAERRRVAAQAGREAARPRTPLAEVAPQEPPAWDARLRLGADVALVSRPFSTTLNDTAMGYEPAIGWGLHVQWDLLRWLRFRAYFIDAHHDIAMPQGTLAPGASGSISTDASLSPVVAETFSFGGKFAPQVQLSPRVRAWVSAGIGWGRFKYSEMTVTEPGGLEFKVETRSAVFVEFPFGLGASYELIDNWLALEYEAVIAPAVGQSGDGHDVVQAVDEAGSIRDIGGFDGVDATFLQTLGLSLIL